MRLFLLLLLLFSCSSEDPDPTPIDGGVTDTGTPDSGAPLSIDPQRPAAPAAPLAPSLLPCPAGWREVTTDEETTCEPWPASGRVDTCAADSAHFLGEGGCARVGAACPAGEWADNLPGGTIHYVRSSTGTGGSGTMADPFLSIASALTAASEGDVIALGKGTFVEAVSLPANTTLWGACTAETILTATATTSSEGSAILTAAPDTTVRQLQITGPRMGVMVGPSPASLTLEDVVVAGAMHIGVRVSGDGQLVMNSVVIRDTESNEGGTYGRGLRMIGGSAVGHRLVLLRNREVGVAMVGGTLALSNVAILQTLGNAGSNTHGRGVLANSAAQVELTGALIEDNREVGISVFEPGTSLRLTDVIVRETHGTGAFSELGTGIASNEGATTVATRLLVERNGNAGVQVNYGDGSFTMTDAVIRDTRGQDGDGMLGRGLELYQTKVSGERLLLSRNHMHGIMVQDGALELSDVTIKDTEPEADGDNGFGMIAVEGATATITRALVAGNTKTGISAADPGTRIFFSDLVVKDIRGGDAVGPCGRGFNLQDGARALLSGAVFERLLDVAVVAHDPSTVLVMEDLVVRDTLGKPDGDMGRAVGAQSGSRVEINRAIFSNNRDTALFAHGPDTVMILSEARVSDTESNGATEMLGRGLNVQEGARAEVSRSLFDNNREVSVLAIGGTLAMSEVVVQNTRARACAETTCVGSEGGIGVASVLDGASVTLNTFLVRDNRLYGVQVAESGTMDLSNGDIVGNAIGANVLTDGFDVNRLLVGIRYIENGQNVDSTFAFVPEGISRLSGGQ